MAIDDLINILESHYSRGSEEREDHRTSQALAIIQEMIDLLEEELKNQYKFNALWKDFSADPKGTASQLTGVLEALIEADPGLGEDLDQLITEYQQGRLHQKSRFIQRKAQTEEVIRSLPESDAPLESKDAVPREDAGEIPRGTYLYGGGDLQAGDITAGERAPDFQGRNTGGEPLNDRAIEQDLLFDQLRKKAQRLPSLSRADRSRLEDKLTALEAALNPGIDADRDELKTILSNIRKDHPQFYRYLRDGLLRGSFFQSATVKKILNNIEEE